ncbi:hypothetical protein HDZ31DRAFT_59855 [Schizophyllum fasciatum]
MSSSPTLATEQLLELLMQLKKTTPDAARQILNAQPQIAYALITLMVSMNAIDIEVFQRTLTSLGPAGISASEPAAASVPPVASAVPPYVQPQFESQYRTPTPPTSFAPQSQPYANGQGRYAAPTSYAPSHTPIPTQPRNAGYGSYQQPGPPQPAPQAANPATAGVAAMLASIPDEQKALVVQLLSLTPEQIAALPPTERANVIQLRTTLGLPM